MNLTGPRLETILRESLRATASPTDRCDLCADPLVPGDGPICGECRDGFRVLFGRDAPSWTLPPARRDPDLPVPPKFIPDLMGTDPEE